MAITDIRPLLVSTPWVAREVFHDSARVYATDRTLLLLCKTKHKWMPEHHTTKAINALLYKDGEWRGYALPFLESPHAIVKVSGEGQIWACDGNKLSYANLIGNTLVESESAFVYSTIVHSQDAKAFLARTWWGIVFDECEAFENGQIKRVNSTRTHIGRNLLQCAYSTEQDCFFFTVTPEYYRTELYRAARSGETKEIHLPHDQERIILCSPYYYALDERNKILYYTVNPESEWNKLAISDLGELAAFEYIYAYEAVSNGRYLFVLMEFKSKTERSCALVRLSASGDEVKLIEIFSGYKETPTILDWGAFIAIRIPYGLYSTSIRKTASSLAPLLIYDITGDVFVGSEMFDVLDGLRAIKSAKKAPSNAKIYSSGTKAHESVLGEDVGTCAFDLEPAESNKIANVRRIAYSSPLTFLVQEDKKDILFSVFLSDDHRTYRANVLRNLAARKISNAICDVNGNLWFTVDLESKYTYIAIIRVNRSESHGRFFSLPGYLKILGGGDGKILVADVGNWCLTEYSYDGQYLHTPISFGRINYAGSAKYSPLDDGWLVLGKEQSGSVTMHHVTRNQESVTLLRLHYANLNYDNLDHSEFCVFDRNIMKFTSDPRKGYVTRYLDATSLPPGVPAGFDLSLCQPLNNVLVAGTRLVTLMQLSSSSQMCYLYDMTEELANLIAVFNTLVRIVPAGRNLLIYADSPITCTYNSLNQPIPQNTGVLFYSPYARIFSETPIPYIGRLQRYREAMAKEILIPEVWRSR